MRALFTLLTLSLSAAAAWAGNCEKPRSGKVDFNSCLSSNNLKWSLQAPQSLTPEDIRRGPKVSPELSPAEKESGIIFCRYYFHAFSSPGSAKFKCARTTADGVLLDRQGHPVPEAQSVSTEGMKAIIDGRETVLNEGMLLDEKNRPLMRTTQNGEKKFLQADDFKVKYFVDINDPAKMRQRQSYQFQFDQRTIQLDNVFVGPTDISTPRWNEVFTEVASTRLFWALGYPADIMIPLNKVVCFGCVPHPKDQKTVDMRQTAVFNTVVIERKMPGTKIGDFFNMNMAVGKYPQWDQQTQNDFEGLALASQLIAYHNFIELQNRMGCAPGAYDEDTRVCSAPMPMMQDLGSTWAGRLSESERTSMGLNDNARGALRIYQKNRTFRNASTCELYYPVTSRLPGEAAKGPAFTKVHREGVEQFKRRLALLTPDVIQALFEVSRYGDMEPKLRDQAAGSTIEEKRAAIIREWSQSLEERLNEIRQSQCPEQSSSSIKENSSSRSPASELTPGLRAQFKNMSPALRDQAIENARVTRADYKFSEVPQINLYDHLRKKCGEDFSYQEQTDWPRLSCNYRPDSQSLGGYSLKFLCTFPQTEKTRKIKYATSEQQLGNSEVIESVAATLLTQLIGFYSETYCPVQLKCLNCPSPNPWKSQRASAAPVAGTAYDFPWAVAEIQTKGVGMTNKDLHPRSQGLAWDELKKVQKLDPTQNRLMRIEREAWLLWMNFLQATDAHNSNQRVSCLNFHISEGGQLVCEESMLYTHDYGHSFYMRFQFNQWKNIPALRATRDGKSCQGTLVDPTRAGFLYGAVVTPIISSEARDLLVSRLSQITDDQLAAVYDLAKIGRAAGIDAQTWTTTFRRKIDEMKKAPCNPLDASSEPGIPMSALSL